MASRKVTFLKFVGTVSLGLLTGTSYTISNLTIPSLLELSSASKAAKTLRSLASTATTHFTALSGVSGSAFFLAFILSPSGYRHPYLLYTSVFSLGAHFADQIAPYIFDLLPPDFSPASHSQRRANLAQSRKDKAAARRMVASYDVLDDSHSEEAASGEEHLDEELNGEDVRTEVDLYVRNERVRTAVAGVGFAMAVLGIWGDGAHNLTDRYMVGL